MISQQTPAPGGSRTTAICLSRGTSLLLASCAVVATSAYLGATWLSSPVLGLPTGVWLIAIAQGAACAIWQRQDRRLAAGVTASGPQPALTASAGAQPAIDTAAASPATITRSNPANILGLDLLPPVGRLAAAACDVTRSACRALNIQPDRIAEIEDQLSIPFDRQTIIARPLRIGLDVEAELAVAIRTSSLSPAAPVEWVRIWAGMDDQRDLSRRRLDAIIRRRDGGLRITTLEHEGRDAAWYDWASLRPLSYASVFPLRIDPATISLTDIDVGDLSQGQLIARLAQLAAALSRTPSRLTLSDRLFGRRAMAGLRTPEQAPLPAEACARDLGMQLERWAGPQGIGEGALLDPGNARRAAARAASAWAVTAETWIDPALRRQIIEAAAQMLPGEPEVHLRLAAVRIADGEDTSAHEAIRTASDLIRRQGHEQIIDHQAFLESELALGRPGPMTLGRVAAGICLVCATSPQQRISYIRDDLMDDIRYSAWLVGRDQDRAMLMDIFRGLEEDASGDPGESRQAA